MFPEGEGSRKVSEGGGRAEAGAVTPSRQVCSRPAAALRARGRRPHESRPTRSGPESRHGRGGERIAGMKGIREGKPGRKGYGSREGKAAAANSRDGN